MNKKKQTADFGEAAQKLFLRKATGGRRKS
jgi:hypothetical protein